MCGNSFKPQHFTQSNTRMEDIIRVTQMQNKYFSQACKAQVRLQIAIHQNSLVNCLAEVPSSTLITL